MKVGELLDRLGIFAVSNTPDSERKLSMEIVVWQDEHSYEIVDTSTTSEVNAFNLHVE